MKIQKVVLKEAVVFEENGEYKRVFQNEKAYPAFLSNASLRYGKQTGLLESSLISEVIKMQGLQKALDNQSSEFDANAAQSIDETNMLQIIYLAVRGANKNLDMTIDEFLERYHASFEETIELYSNLIMDVMSSNPNAFAKGLKDSTSSGRKHQKK
jgi:hypothetical protein